MRFLATVILSAGILCGCDSDSTGQSHAVVDPGDTTHAVTKDSVNSDPKKSPPLILLSPQGGGYYKLGDSLHIRAATEGNTQDALNAVDVLLSPDAGRTWGALSDRPLTLDSRTDLDFAWLIPAYFMANGKRFLLAENGFCRIRLAWHGSEDTLKASVSANFMIEDTAYIRLTNPLGGETYHVGDTLRITWTVKAAPDPIEAVDVMLSPDSGKTWGYLRVGSVVPQSPAWRNTPWTVPESLSVLGTKTGLVGNPGVRVRVQSYTTPDPKWGFQSGMISILPR